MHALTYVRFLAAYQGSVTGKKGGVPWNPLNSAPVLFFNNIIIIIMVFPKKVNKQVH